MRTFIFAATALTGALAIAGPADAQRATHWSGGGAARPAPVRAGGAQANANGIVRAQINANANANASANARSFSRTVVGGGAQRGPSVDGNPRTWSHTGGQQIGGDRRSWGHGNAGRPNMPHRPRWGGMTQGRWYAGYDAPGGWNAYRRPSRGWTLPRYWYAPSFYITDFATYGLGAPSSGYMWTRYYDDAVLVDNGGRVYDSVTGIDWARGDAAYDSGYASYDGDYAEAYADETVTGGYAADEGYAYDSTGPQRPLPSRRDDGLGGAVIGGVVGGAAGNVIAGRGNRLGGTLIGAGAGAIAGAAIDRAEDRGRPAPGYGAGYPAPVYDGRGGPPPVVFAPPAEVVQQHHVERDERLSGYDSRAYTTRSYASSPYYAPATTTYAGPNGTTTVVTVTPSVTTTTTTTEFIEEPARVVYRKAAKRTWKPKVRQCTCKCTITCR